MLEESLEKGKSISCVDTHNYNRWYKDLHFNEFQYSQLTKMTEGQTFALASPEGLHIFKMIKFESYQKEEQQLTQQKEKQTNG